MEEENKSCLLSIFPIIIGFLVFAGVGALLFKFIEVAGKYIVITFWVIVGIAVIAFLVNNRPK